MVTKNDCVFEVLLVLEHGTLRFYPPTFIPKYLNDTFIISQLRMSENPFILLSSTFIPPILLL